MTDDLCPTCHSKIGTDSTSDAGRIQGKEGTDEFGNPIPRWSDDPVFTGRGLSGSPYDKQSTRARKKHIKEIQETRVTQEDESGVDSTDFSDINDDKHISRKHFIELRESTEKLLNAAGITLEDYFKLDDESNEQPQNPNVARAGGNTPQDEWVDVERGAEYISKDGSLKSDFTLPDASTAQSPTIPKRTHIRAIHLEDLRHPIPTGIPAILVGSIGFLTDPIGQDDTVFAGVKKAGANFEDLFSCNAGG